MARPKEELNVFQLLLIRTILLLQFRLEGKKIFRADLKHISDDLYKHSAEGASRADKDVIAKFFNAAHNLNRPIFFGHILDAIIVKLNIEKCTNFGIFDANYGSHVFFKEKSRFLPVAHPEDVSTAIMEEITPLVSKIVSNFFPGEEERIKVALGSSLRIESTKKISKKFEDNFANTKWYFYFFYDSKGSPKIGRLLFTINNDGSADLKHFHHIEDASFSGNIRFDKKESYLIYTAKSSRYEENDLFMIFDARNSMQPEILLGHFFNIGLNSDAIVWGNCIAHKVAGNCNDLKPRYFDPSDPDFVHIPASIIRYLKYENKSFSRFSSKIFSLEKLALFLKEEKKKAPHFKQYVRQRKEYTVYIAFPRAEISEVRRIGYISAFHKLTSFFDNHGFISHRSPVANLELSFRTSILEAHQFIEHIESSDVFIFLYLDKVRSTSLLEMAWAYQMGKKIIVLTRQGDNIISRFKNSDFLEVIHVPESLVDFDEVINWSIKIIPYFLKEKFGIPLTGVEQKEED